MERLRNLGVALLALAGSALAQPPNRFAARVVSYVPGTNVNPNFSDPQRFLGPPQGSLDVVQLGIRGTLTVGFDVTIVDGPGPDLTVWENGFRFGSDFVFAELARVGVSSDGIHYATFPPEYYAGPLGQFETMEIGATWGMAGASEGFGMGDPLRPSRSQGDFFDLGALRDEPLVRIGLVDLNAIRFLRLTDIRGDGSERDRAGRPIIDPTGMNDSADFDAAAALNIVGEDAARPRAAVVFDPFTRVVRITLADPEGLLDLDLASVDLLFNLDLIPGALPLLLTSLTVESVTPLSATLVSPPFPAGFKGRVLVGVSDQAGRLGAGVDYVRP